VPTTTYNNLSDDKKARLIKAGRREFTKHSLQTSSLNSILKRAEIPKGSFYAYFQDKEEFYWYILNDVIRPRISSYESLLSEFEGDLFLIEEIHLQEMIHLLKDYEFSGLLRNMFLYSYHDVRHKVFDHSEVSFALMYSIHIRHKKHFYKVKNEQEFHAFYDLLTNMAHACIFGIVSNSYSEDYAINLYQKQISYVYDGLYK